MSGWNLFDTAGLRQTEDAIEAEGIRRSWKTLEEAGLVLAVFDLAAPLNEEDLEIARRCQGRPALAILNKQDLAGQGEAFTAAQQQRRSSCRLGKHRQLPLPGGDRFVRERNLRLHR